MTKVYTKLEHSKESFLDYFVVNWCFFSICNYSCNYCPEILHDGKKLGQPLVDVKKFCKKVVNLKSDKKVFFEFTGGEITYYKHFYELFSFIKSIGGITGLISNGSRTLAFWEKNRDVIDHVCLSYHYGQSDPAHFYEVVKLLNENCMVHVNIMMLPEKFDELLAFAEKISSEFEQVGVSIQTLFEGISGDIFEYTPEQKRILDLPELPFKKNIIHANPPGKIITYYRGQMTRTDSNGNKEIVNPAELIAKRDNNWLGWQCNVGVENIVVDFNGNIRRGWCEVGGVIGSITDNDLQLPSRPITCTTTNCHCALDLMTTKWKI